MYNVAIVSNEKRLCGVLAGENEVNYGNNLYPEVDVMVSTAFIVLGDI